MLKLLIVLYEKQLTTWWIKLKTNNLPIIKNKILFPTIQFYYPFLIAKNYYDMCNTPVFCFVNKSELRCTVYNCFPYDLNQYTSQDFFCE